MDLSYTRKGVSGFSHPVVTCGVLDPDPTPAGFPAALRSSSCVRTSPQGLLVHLYAPLMQLHTWRTHAAAHQAHSLMQLHTWRSRGVCVQPSMDACSGACTPTGSHFKAGPQRERGREKKEGGREKGKMKWLLLELKTTGSCYSLGSQINVIERVRNRMCPAWLFLDLHNTLTYTACGVGLQLPLLRPRPLVQLRPPHGECYFCTCTSVWWRQKRGARGAVEAAAVHSNAQSALHRFACP